MLRHYRSRYRMLSRKQLFAPIGGIAFCNIVIFALLYSYVKPKQLLSPGVESVDVLVRNVPSKDMGSNSRKTILLWNFPEAVSYPRILDPSHCKNCIVTRNRTLYDYSDAVVFNFRRIRKFEDLPKRSQKKPNQVFVWLCRESPKTTLNIYKRNLKNLNNTFNWTMTYRLDSDVFYPYVEMLHRMHDDKRLKGTQIFNEKGGFVDMYYTDVDSLMKRKKFLAAWVVGNCAETAGARTRMKLVNELVTAGLKIDRFGNCFKESDFPPYRSEEAHERLMEYKFYLAFENTNGCREYMTYKFWKNAMYSGAVPIVWGPSKEDVRRLAPYKSFIHVEDFATSAELVKYLDYLNHNHTAYREYFSWREEEFPRTNSTQMDIVRNSSWIFSKKEALGFCKLCRMLHSGDRFPRKLIPSLEHWWYGTEQPACLSPS